MSEYKRTYYLHNVYVCSEEVLEKKLCIPCNKIAIVYSEII